MAKKDGFPADQGKERPDDTEIVHNHSRAGGVVHDPVGSNLSNAAKRILEEVGKCLKKWKN